MGLPTFICKTVLGWRVTGGFPPDLKKCVVIVAPHTSWHDFFVGLFARKAVKTQIHWLGKKELFAGPLKYYFKWTGGTPLDRTSGQNKVQAIAKIFETKEEFRLALAPEGTRKKVEKWRTGFYFIASEAKVPIIPVSFDYGTRVVTVGAPFYPTGEVEADVAELQKFYRGVKGKND